MMDWYVLLYMIMGVYCCRASTDLLSPSSSSSTLYFMRDVWSSRYYYVCMQMYAYWIYDDLCVATPVRREERGGLGWGCLGLGLFGPMAEVNRLAQPSIFQYRSSLDNSEK